MTYRCEMLCKILCSAVRGLVCIFSRKSGMVLRPFCVSVVQECPTVYGEVRDMALCRIYVYRRKYIVLGISQAMNKCGRHIDVCLYPPAYCPLHRVYVYTPIARDARVRGC